LFSLPLNGTTRECQMSRHVVFGNSNMEQNDSLTQKIKLAAVFCLFLVILLVTGKELRTLAVDFWNGLCGAVLEIETVIEQLPI